MLSESFKKSRIDESSIENSCMVRALLFLKVTSGTEEYYLLFSPNYIHNKKCCRNWLFKEKSRKGESSLVGPQQWKCPVVMGFKRYEQYIENGIWIYDMIYIKLYIHASRWLGDLKIYISFVYNFLKRHDRYFKEKYIILLSHKYKYYIMVNAEYFFSHIFKIYTL